MRENDTGEAYPWDPHPDEGRIRAFGILHTHPDYFQVRQRIGTVLQDDHLFKGSVADNIIFSVMTEIMNE